MKANQYNSGRMRGQARISGNILLQFISGGFLQISRAGGHIEMKNQKRINFILNGERISTSFKPGESALDIIRERLGITAVKQGCEGEGCGACTLIVDDRAVYSCMMPSFRLNGVGGQGVITAGLLISDASIVSGHNILYPDFLRHVSHAVEGHSRV